MSVLRGIQRPDHEDHNQVVDRERPGEAAYELTQGGYPGPQGRDSESVSEHEELPMSASTVSARLIDEHRPGMTRATGMTRDAVQLVEELRRVIADERVLDAMAEVPRDMFAPVAVRDHAWENRAIPIGSGQTMSQPTVVARMCELLELRGDERVLDVGTGSGYHAAVLSRLAAQIYSIERHAHLSRQAESALANAGINNVKLLIGDGGQGYPECGPYDGINVAAVSDRVPAELEEQLALGGRLIIPLDGASERLTLVRRTESGIERQQLEPVRFVPLIRDCPSAS